MAKKYLPLVVALLLSSCGLEAGHYLGQGQLAQPRVAVRAKTLPKGSLVDVEKDLATEDEVGRQIDGNIRECQACIAQLKAKGLHAQAQAVAQNLNKLHQEKQTIASNKAQMSKWKDANKHIVQD